MGIEERKAREKENRVTGILDTAEKIAHEKGIQAITMDAIAEAAELSKGTLYLYFKSKEDLFFAVMLRAQEQMMIAMREAAVGGATAADKLMAYGRSYLESYRTAPAAHRTMMNFNYYFHANLTTMFSDYQSSPYARQIEERNQALFRELVELINAGVADGSIANRTPPPVLVMLVTGMSSGMLEVIHHATMEGGPQMLEQLYGMPVEKIIDYTLEFIGLSLQSNPETFRQED